MNYFKISIITVCYNSGKTIEQTIQSVLNQSYNNIEYIIIDGGSTDETISIIKKYEHSIAKWISEPDKGISDAFNKGIRLATGDIIGIINSDDWYEPSCFDHIIKNYEKADVLHGIVRYWKENNEDYAFSANINKLPKEMTVNHMSVFVKKDVYDKNDLFSLKFKYAMDYEIMLRFYNSGISFYFIENILANMRLEGASDLNWKKAYWESKLIKDEILGPSIFNYTYFFWQVLRTTLRNFFILTNMNFIVSLFRNYASITSKNRKS